MDGDEPEMQLVSVGVAHTPYETTDEAPHQGFADDAESEIEIFEAYSHALAGIEDTHRLTVVYWAHEAERDRAGESAAEDWHGAFAGRGPNRPNPLSICTCLVLAVDGRRIRVRGLDAIDGSPVVDVKPALQAER